MADPTAKVPVTSSNLTHSATLSLCWCCSTLQGMVNDKTLEKKMKKGVSGDDVKELHKHLLKFKFDLELKNTKSGTPEESEDLKGNKWGKFTTRAVRMFAKRPQVKAEPEKIIKTTGKANKPINGEVLTEEIVAKIQQWCKDNTESNQNYWEFKQLLLDGKDQMIDAYGDDLGKGTQSAWHHHLLKIQEDFTRTGFAADNCPVCAASACKGCQTSKAAKPDGTYRQVKDIESVNITKNFLDLKYLTRKFQRQAKWLWRMDKSGKHLPDATAGDATHYAGTVNGVMDHETAKVLHAWAEKGLHMVLNKFELKGLNWPPASATPIVNSDDNKAAKIRLDAHTAWVKAATEIEKKGGTLAGPYASSPRHWTSGKPSSAATSANANSAFSWHYSGLAIDISQSFASGDGTIHKEANAKGEQKFRYVLENDGDKFRIWCWVMPQPAAPADATKDKDDDYVQYRNRNIRNRSAKPGKEVKAGQPSDTSPLFHQNGSGGSFAETAVPEGWYLDVTKIMGENNFARINRKASWKTNDKAWEFWHYQFEPPDPPGAEALPGHKKTLTFGDYLQLYGVHEYHLREKNWSAHADVEHEPG